MVKNIQTFELQKTDSVFIPLNDVFITLQSHVNAIKPGLQLDWFEYMQYMLKYIFDDDRGTNTSLFQTECRTMLSQHGFSEEQMVWVEHNVISIAIMLIGDILAYIRMMSQNNLINGFYWDFNNSKDLIIQISYK